MGVQGPAGIAGATGATGPTGTAAGFALSGSDVVTTNTGNLGVGTTTPTSKLDVVGDVHATGRFISDKPTYAMTRNFSDQRPVSPGAYVDIPERTVTYTKLSNTTALLVTYEDSFGFVMNGTASIACMWRILLDGSIVGREKYSHSSSATNWRIWSGSYKWFLTGVSAGTHTIKVQVNGPNAGATASNGCLHGWSNGTQENFLLVQEI